MTKRERAKVVSWKVANSAGSKYRERSAYRRHCVCRIAASVLAAIVFAPAAVASPVAYTDSTGGTPPHNGKGNLIVGYNEDAIAPIGKDRTGVHNLVVGPEHTFSSYGGVVAGLQNTVSAKHASVSGGRFNSATEFGASVSAGDSNDASGYYASSASGGQLNEAGYSFRP